MSKAIEAFKNIIRETGEVPTLKEFMKITGYKRDSYYRAKRDYLTNGLERIIDKPPYNEQKWKVVKDFDNYLISDQGIVYNISSNKICSPSVNQYGYYFLGLNKDKIYTTVLLHQLIAQAFIPNPDNKPTVDHINRIKTDNRIENLRWATIKEQNSNKNTNVKVKDIITGQEFPTISSFKQNVGRKGIYIKCLENDKIYQNWKELAIDLFPDKKIKTVQTGVLRALKGKRPYLGFTFLKAHDYEFQNSEVDVND